MKRLVLIRHAKSSWNEPGLADFERSLNERGERDAPRMGKRLHKRGLAPDLVVSSPARRAMTTAQIIAAAIDYPVEAIRTIDAIYEASLEALLGVVRDIPDSHHEVVLFGHNPGITMFANALAAVDIDNVPTCGVATIELEVDSWSAVEYGSGRLLDFDYPKKHKAG